MKKTLYLAFFATTLFVADTALSAEYPYKLIRNDAYGRYDEKITGVVGNNPGSITYTPPAAQGCTRVFKGEDYYRMYGYWGTITCTPPNRRHFWTTERCKQARLHNNVAVTFGLNADCSETATDGLYALTCKDGHTWDSNKEVCVPKKFKVNKGDLSGGTSEDKTYSQGNIKYAATLPASHYCTANYSSVSCKQNDPQKFFSKARCEKYITDSIMTSKHAYCSNEDKDGISTLTCKDGYPWETRFTIAKNVCGNSFKIQEYDLGDPANYLNNPIYLGKRYTPTNSDYEIDKVAAEIKNGRPEKSGTGETCERAGSGNVYIRCSLPVTRFYTKAHCESYIGNEKIEATCQDKGKYTEAVCKSGYVLYTTSNSFKCLACPENCKTCQPAACTCSGSRNCCQGYVPTTTTCSACKDGYMLRNGKCLKNTVSKCEAGLAIDNAYRIYCSAE